MTIARWGALEKAAHEPSPAKGLSGMPSTLSGTSFRGQAMRTVPSGVVVALVAAVGPIRSAESPSSGAAKAGRAAVRGAVAVKARARTYFIVRLMVRPL